MTTIRPERLRDLTLFANLDERLLHELARLMRHQHCPAGATIFAQHDDRREVYVILRGHLRVIAYSQTGRETIFHDLHTGDMVGQLAAIDGGMRVASLVAIDNSEVGQIEPVAFNRLLREEPAFALVVIDQLARQIRALNQRVLLLAAPVPLRVCGELLRLAERCKVSENTARLAPPPKHLELANRLNTNREAVSRTLAVLQRLGIIERGRAALLVRDIAALRRHVEGEPLPTRPKPAAATSTATVPAAARLGPAPGGRPRAPTTTPPIRSDSRD